MKTFNDYKGIAQRNGLPSYSNSFDREGREMVDFYYFEIINKVSSAFQVANGTGLMQVSIPAFGDKRDLAYIKAAVYIAEEVLTSLGFSNVNIITNRGDSMTLVFAAPNSTKESLKRGM